MTNKKKSLITLLFVSILVCILLFPVVKAKYKTSINYSFLVHTKMQAVENKAFNFTGNSQSYVLPKEGYYVFQIWGADGGSSSNEYNGGKGDNFTIIGYFTGNQTLKIYVGGLGKQGSGSTGGLGGYNGGGPGGSGGWFASNSGGGGGGATSIIWDGNNSPLIIAGGGGGAGAGGNNSLTTGGNVSSEAFNLIYSGVNSNYYRPGLAGIGDANLIGGIYSGGGGSTEGGKTSYISASDLSQGTDGVERLGGTGGNWAGGGGGGFYGGGGGSSTNAISGGGGAGSSFYASGFSITMPASVESKLPSNQDFPLVPYENGSGYLILTYIGKKIPNTYD